MAGSKEGALKREQTLIAKYGSLEAYKEAMREFANRVDPANRGRGGFKHLKESGQTKRLKEIGKLGAEVRWRNANNDSRPVSEPEE